MRKATKRGGSQIRAKATKGSKSVGTKKTVKAAPRRTAVKAANSIALSGKLMKQLSGKAEAAGFKNVQKFVTTELTKVANA